MGKKIVLVTITCLTVSGCDLMSDRLDQVGRVPELSKINIYEEPFYPINEQVELRAKLSDLGYENGYKYDESRGNNGKQPKGSSANSLWKSGSRSFIKAYGVGDILSVVVQISDQARLDNQTQKSRSDSSKLAMPSMLGLETVVNNVLPGSSSADSMVNMKGSSSDSGAGKINRKETVQTTIAVTIIKVLPSGNLVVKGTQEVRVNFDLREVTIEGIVRPSDITMNNTVNLEQIAEARVSYGGRGQIFEYQQPPYGKQVLDIITPF
jgi:flagellar L-ring protein precursor FlgH